jgi:spermidine/putrescine transport system permease protein
MVRMGIKPEVNALATLLFGLSMALILLSQRLLERKL